MSISSTSASKGVAGFGRRRGERVQVDDDKIQEAHAQALEGGEIVRAIAARENAAVNRRVQRLDAAVHHLGKTGELGDADDREARGGQGARGAAGGHELESAGREAARPIRRCPSCPKRSAGLLAY